MPNATEIDRRDQGYKYVTGCNAGENFDDFWNVDGDSDTWTGFTTSTMLDEKDHRMDIPGPWRD